MTQNLAGVEQGFLLCKKKEIGVIHQSKLWEVFGLLGSKTLIKLLLS